MDLALIVVAGIFAVICVVIGIVSQAVYALIPFYGVLFLTVYLSLKFYRNYKHYKANFHNFFLATNPYNTVQEDFFGNNTKDDEKRAFEACQIYAFHGSFDSVKEKLDLSEPTQAKRLVLKGIKLLIKNYGEKHE